MPYKDPAKRLEMDRVYQAKYRATEKGRVAARRSSRKYDELHPHQVREWVRERVRRWRLTPKGKANAAAQYARELPERRRARAAVTHAVRMGHLVRMPCRECGAV